MLGAENTSSRPNQSGLSNGTRPAGPGPSPASPINLHQGDPVMFEEYWRKAGEKSDLAIGGAELMSYMSNPRSACWFLLPELEDSIRRIHRLAGNAATEGRHIVVGTGSTQLLQAVLYALSWDSPQPLSIVAAAPYYSCYPEVTGILKSGLYKWEGDAYSFDKDGPFVELVTLPNNPDGSIRGPVAKRSGDGHVVYDFAYYWPQYTAITHQADHDIMLFTFSKCTGHAGSRVGWAIVKDKEMARKMVKFIEVTSIGVSKEAQFRASKILGAVCDVYESSTELPESEKFFEYFKRVMTERWDKLREVVKGNEIFSLPKFPQEYCLFSKELAETRPAFAWLKCKEELEDAESLLRAHKILGRGGLKFGVDSTFVRVSMLGREDTFNTFLERLPFIGKGGIIGSGVRV